MVVATPGLASHATPSRAAVGSTGSARAFAPTMKWDVNIAPWELDYGLQRAPVNLPESVREGDPPQPFEVTDEQRKTLYEEGAIVIPGVLNEEWLKFARDATDWQVNHPHFWSIAGVASGLYDYIQRSVWASNSAFADLLYYSPIMSALAGSCNAKELRLTTDLLMVNPNKGFKWHQDNQNGPVAFEDALRWWVTLDDTPADHGAPVYLRKSHLNTDVSADAVFVDLREGQPAAVPGAARVPAEGGRPDRLALARHPQDRRAQERRTGSRAGGACSAGRWPSTMQSTWRAGGCSSRTWARTAWTTAMRSSTRSSPSSTPAPIPTSGRWPGRAAARARGRACRGCGAACSSRWRRCPPSPTS